MSNPIKKHDSPKSKETGLQVQIVPPQEEEHEQHHRQQQQQQSSHPVVFNLWTRFTMSIHRFIQRFVTFLSVKSARHPKRCIFLISFLSIALLGIGFATNFEIRLDDERVYAPWDARPREHAAYLDKHIPPSQVKRRALLIVHADGDNVMDYEAMRRLFVATDTVLNLDGYNKICKEDLCPIAGPTIPWDHDIEAFKEDTQGSDQQVILKLSQDYFGAVSEFIGNSERETTEYSGGQEVITYAESLMAFMELPTLENGETQAFEAKLLDASLALKYKWEEEDQPYRLEALTLQSLPNEMVRAVNHDIPLLGAVFVVMTLFCSLVFGRRDPVQSRALLGFGSIVSILLSIMSGFGLAFIIGIPFTTFTQILPFAVFGIGLDDTFIITGAYFRTDASKEPVERIQDTMEEVGTSICLTTITTVLAFILGWLSSSIPCVQWVCIYAFPTIILVLLYQITFFVSIIVLDEERVQKKRRDCCICFTVHDASAEEASSEECENDSRRKNQNTSTQRNAPKETLSDRFITWYWKQLLRPIVKVTVLLVFLGYMGACAYNIPRLSQSFSPKELLPTDSYVLQYLKVVEEYTNREFGINVYFTEVDQSDPDIQEQMIQYVDELARLPQIRGYEGPCWVIDLKEIQERIVAGNYSELDPYRFIFEEDYSFNERLNMMLSVPEISQVYGSSIIRDEDTGEIIVSKCFVPASHVDLDDTDDQIKFLLAQRNVTAAQPINQGRDRFAFFSHTKVFFIWEFFRAAKQALVSTTVSGIVAVCVVAFLLIPHWTAIGFIFPLIIILYIDLVGTLHFAGLSLNPLTYIVLVMSIGLLVDFIMHVLLRFYECRKPTREEKVLETLRTIGSSILLGGLSTFLGVLPLAFASSEIISNVFIMFIALVSLGVTHGLIFLPVVLSSIGPTVHATTNRRKIRSQSSTEARSMMDGSTFSVVVERQPGTPETTENSADSQLPSTSANVANIVSSIDVDEMDDAPDDVSC